MKSRLLLATSILSIFALNGCLDEVADAPDMSALACKTEPLDDESGLKIICGGDSVGVVLNGKDGKDGLDGSNGKNGNDGKKGKDGTDGKDGLNGNDGTSCRVEESAEFEGYDVFCGDEKVGELRNGKDGEKGKDGNDGKDGTSCSVVKNEKVNGYEVYCGTEFIGLLKDGTDGKDGLNGNDGTSCRVEESSEFEGYDVFCGDEKVGELRNGKDGEKGKDGNDGKDGTSCSVVKNEKVNGYEVYCGTEFIGLLKNGTDGKDGLNGNDGTSCRVEESSEFEGYDVFCGDEKVGELRNGKDGEKGKDGNDGKDGTSCSVVKNEKVNGYEVYCGTEFIGLLKNGTDGKDGLNGNDGTSCRVEESAEFEGYDVFCGDEKVGELRNGKDGADAKPVEILSNACNTLRSTTDMFSSMYDVFYCLRPNEKVAFILRHAARDRNNTGTNGSLNQTGIEQSTQVGQKLKKLNIDDFFYMHTNVYRTQQTARIISENKGQTTGSEDEWKNTTSNEYHAQNMDLLESWYIRNDNRKRDCQGQNSWGWSIYSKVAYEEYDKKNNSDSENKAACEDALYNIEERTQELISTYFTYDNMHKMTLAISHDQFLVPFVIAISHKKIHDDQNYTLQFHKHENNFNYWINYLTGVAIIVDPENNTTVIPVTALDDGFLRSY